MYRQRVCEDVNMMGIDWERVIGVIQSNLVATLLGAALGAWGTWYYERRKYRRDSSWTRATIIVERLGLIFSRPMLEAINSVERLNQIRVEWGTEAERFDYLADQKVGKQLDDLVRPYLEAMKGYLNGEKQQAEVESLRQTSNREARALIQDFLAKHGANLQTSARQP